jgi:hypothetical protein
VSHGGDGCHIVAWGCSSAVSCGGGGGSGGSLFSSETDQLMLQRTNVPLVLSNIRYIYLSTGFIVRSDHHQVLPRPVTPVSILTMPLLSNTEPNTPDLNVVQGPRKHCLTQRLRENGDPLASKRPSKQAPSATLTVSDSPTASVSPALQVLSGAVGVTVSTPTATTSLSLQRHDTPADSRRDNGASDSHDMEPIDVDDSNLGNSSEHGNSEGKVTEQDEDDDTELGKSSININNVIGLSVV